MNVLPQVPTYVRSIATILLEDITVHATTGSNFRTRLIVKILTNVFLACITAIPMQVVPILPALSSVRVTMDIQEMA